MKLTQLLTSVAAVALLAGTAQAQLADVGGVAGTDITTTTVIADEFTGSVADEILLTFNAGADPFATVGVGESVEFNITLTNAVFTVAVPAAAWDTDATNEAPNTSTCDFGNVSAGGGLGQSTVSWTRQIAAPNECTQALFNGDVGDLRIAIERADASLPATIQYGFRPVATANFTADTQTETLLVNASAYNPDVDAGDAADNLLSSDGTAATGGFTGDLGHINGGFLAATAAIISRTEGDLAAGADIREDADAGATLPVITAGDGIAGAGDIVATIQFADLTGIQSVTLAGDACDLDTNANTATCDDLTPAEFDATDRDILFTLTADATDVVAQQTPTVTLAITDENNWNIEGISTAQNLAAISWDDGVTNRTPIMADNTPNLFRWTNLRTSGGTQSNFRITNMGTNLTVDSDECIQVTVSNTSGALPGNATACLAANDVTVTADGVAANRWTATFNSTAVANALGVTNEAINGDIRFVVITNDNAGTVVPEISRLLIKNGIVSGTAFDTDG